MVSFDWAKPVKLVYISRKNIEVSIIHESIYLTRLEKQGLDGDADVDDHIIYAEFDECCTHNKHTPSSQHTRCVCRAVIMNQWA